MYLSKRFDDTERGLGKIPAEFEEDVLARLIDLVNGDARMSLIISNYFMI